MPTLGLERSIVDRQVYENTLQRFREAQILLPTFAQLTEPSRIPEPLQRRLLRIDPDVADPLNLFRIHWQNGESGQTMLSRPEVLELPASLTGVPARIVVLLADRFPMIHAHKVLATYGCLVPRLVTGQFDPIHHRAVWPSTGNYCRGGIAVSRILNCRGVAVLPEGMSSERFRWLEEWVSEPSDIIRTPGSESNVREIYERCAELDRDPDNIIFNQFSEFGNYLAHFLATGRALQRVFESLAATASALRLRAFVSATGSGGTIAAGDHLKELFGSLTVAVEALECPTLLYNGFGEHNIQGIGDKHVPLIHNVLDTDLVTAVSDAATDQLLVLFSSEAGRRHLVDRHGVSPEVVQQLPRLGLSSICNVLAAIHTARYLGFDERDVILTVATDGAELYRSEFQKISARDFPDGFDAIDAAEVFGHHLLGAAPEHLLELSHRDRDRIFNLGYFTWVEQQGLEIEQFEARRQRAFWKGLRELPPVWDEMIEETNERTGVGARV